MITTPNLIDELARRFAPVRRLAPPLVRAGVWLSLTLVISAAAILAFSDLRGFARRLSDSAFAVEMGATLITGVCAVIAAFMLSVPDRSRAWAFLPVAPLLVWLGASGTQCLREFSVFGASGWSHAATPACLYFIVGVGLPMAISLLLVLRVARPLAPIPVAILGGLGAGALAAVVLQFFHPFDVTFLDLGFHLSAVAALLGASALAARFNALGRAGRSELGMPHD